MKHDDAIAAALANRSFVYTYLWRAFAAEPDKKAFLSAVADDATLEECKLLAGEDSRAVQVQEALAAFVRNVPDAPDALKGEYTKLFEGPGKLPRAALGVGLRVRRGLLFQPSTLEVREKRRTEAPDNQATGYPHEADGDPTLRPSSTSWEHCQNAPKPPMKRGTRMRSACQFPSRCISWAHT